MRLYLISFELYCALDEVYIESSFVLKLTCNIGGIRM